MTIIFEEKGYQIDTDSKRLDIEGIHKFLNEESYWAKNRTLEQTKNAIAHSLCFGVYNAQGRQVGFARVITDYAVFAYLCDVFILKEERGKGLGKNLIEQIVQFGPLSTIRSILLTTNDAHGLYQRYGGFDLLTKPENWLLRRIEQK